MPLANIKIIEGVFNADERRRMIEAVTEALVSVEGEGIREKTVVIVEETGSGNWGVGGHVLTADIVREQRNLCRPEAATTQEEVGHAT